MAQDYSFLTSDPATVSPASDMPRIQAAITSLLSVSSGASEPSSPVAYMLWADTTSGLLKQRNGANSAWVTIGTLDAEFLGLASKSANNTFTKAQRGTPSPLTPGATIPFDLALANHFTLVIDQNSTINNPTNIVAGQTGTITVTQDTTGAWALAWGSFWKFAGGSPPVLSTAANAIDKLAYQVRSATEIDVDLIGRNYS